MKRGCDLNESTPRGKLKSQEIMAGAMNREFRSCGCLGRKLALGCKTAWQAQHLVNLRTLVLRQVPFFCIESSLRLTVYMTALPGLAVSPSRKNTLSMVKLWSSYWFICVLSCVHSPLMCVGYMAPGQNRGPLTGGNEQNRLRGRSRV